MKQISIISIAAMALSIIFTSSAVAAPKGAVKLASDKIFANDAYYCGKIKGAWIAGRLLSKGYFYSHAAERKNVLAQAKSAKGKTKSKLNKKAKNLKVLIAARNPECSGGPTDDGPDNPTPTPTPTLTPSAQPLQFSFTDAVGLVLGELSLTSVDTNGISSLNNGNGSNMRKVKSSGDIEEVVSSGSANISRFLIAPNEKIYVLFNDRTNLEDTSQVLPSDGCLLAEVNKVTGEPICIDNDVSSVEWLDTPRNAAIQFDASGSIYYSARNSDGNTILRKYSGGQHSDLINQNITIFDFLVISDGSVIIYGRTDSTQARWLRRITPQGGLQTIRTIQACNQGITFMKIFPDGKIYTGIDDCNLMGVYRMSPDASTLEDAPWFGRNMNGEPAPVEYECTIPNDSPNDWLYNCGTSVTALHITPSQKVFGITTVGFNNLRKTLVQYHDAYSRPTLAIKDVKVFQNVQSNEILAGLNNVGQNILTLFDTSNNTETELIGPSNEIEIYHINYVEADNKIMFDGLRFSDNKYVLGQVDLDTMQVAASQTGTTKLEDFQTF